VCMCTCVCVCVRLCAGMGDSMKPNGMMLVSANAGERQSDIARQYDHP